MKAENFFHSLMNQKGIPVRLDDDWYDFTVYDKIKVEVKSCQLSIKFIRDKKPGFRPGRFDFTKEDNREEQFKENIWVCLIVRHHDQFILYGFVKARELKKKRYWPITTVRELKPLEFDEWFQRIQAEKVIQNAI